MIISKNLTGSGFSIKTKTASVEVSRKNIKINGFEITSPGEYDLSGCSCDVLKIDGHIHALLEAEMILLGALDANFCADELSEDFTQVSVLLLFLDDEKDLKSGTGIVGRIEPQFVCYFCPNGANLSTITGLETVDNLKISKNDLLFEGSRHILLK